MDEFELGAAQRVGPQFSDADWFSKRNDVIMNQWARRSSAFISQRHHVDNDNQAEWKDDFISINCKFPHRFFGAASNGGRARRRRRPRRRGSPEAATATATAAATATATATTTTATATTATATATASAAALGPAPRWRWGAAAAGSSFWSWCCWCGCWGGWRCAAGAGGCCWATWPVLWSGGTIWKFKNKQRQSKLLDRVMRCRPLSFEPLVFVIELNWHPSWPVKSHVWS